MYYPALFIPEKKGYSVIMYDFEGCVSQGDTFEEAYENIKDALSLYLEDAEFLPTPTNASDLLLAGNEIIVLIEAILPSES